MWSTTGISAWPTSLSFISNITCLNVPNILEFHLFADNTNFFPISTTNISNLETHLNGELQKVCQLFYPNNLSLNIEKPFLWYSILPLRRIADKLNLIASNKLCLLNLITRLNV